MGQVSTEQTVEIIEAVGDAINAASPEVVQIQPEPNYWWLLLIAVVPVLLGLWIKRKK